MRLAASLRRLSDRYSAVIDEVRPHAFGVAQLGDADPEAGEEHARPGTRSEVEDDRSGLGDDGSLNVRPGDQGLAEPQTLRERGRRRELLLDR